MAWAILIILAIVAAGIGFYNFMQGETLVRDVIDEIRLHRADIHALDAAWAANPNRSDCVVSLTSLPSRLPYIDSTLKSLMRQDKAPARIRLNLPYFSKREGKPYEVPAWLEKLQSVELIRCEDFGPATKLIPSVTGLPQDQKIIVVDDDRIYPANLIADLDAAATRSPDAAMGLGGWVVPGDLIDRKTTVLSSTLMRAPAPLHAIRLRKPRPVDILQGLAGFLVRPRFFDLNALTDYTQAPQAAFFVDDVWISAHCVAPKYVIPARRAGHVLHRRRKFYWNTGLGLANRGDGNPNNNKNTIVIQHFAGRWRVGGLQAGKRQTGRGD